ncbi:MULTISPECIES: amino acid adenylation domain-containing protein [Streptomyces]|uniref:Nonribosomal peptide synthetase n=1 Tax=Streptomyces vinaceus TaxID=1960 RepID=Q6WZA7_STRVI|nr:MULTISPECIES: amino acid adenylation domain-containing protein [Streptomyces]AAP92496.1 nonribosomal peptide synthetase [Streptomyces vinaceus]MDP9953660.1 nonribosomal peptide synthetase protein VioF [Streptomyces sp. DSM 41269]
MTDLDFTSWDLRTEADRRAFPGGLDGPAPSWNTDTTLVRIVWEQVTRTPHAEAVRVGDRALTYRELADSAARVARWAAGLRSDRERELRIGVVAHRSLPVYPVLLGVLAAGGSYVPLDPAAPVRRLREVARRAELAAVVTDAEGWAGLGLSDIAGLLVDRALPFQRGRLGGGTLTEFESLPEADGALPGAGRPGGPRPDDVAYTVFTSGSTGAPKGVLVEHRGAVNLARWVAGTTDLGPGSRVTQNASLHFDASVQQIFSAWSAGATLLPVPETVRVDGARLYGWLAEQGVTHWDSVPSLWAPVVEHCAGRIAAGETVLPALRAVLLAGEVLPAARVNEWRPWQQGHRLFNIYGPTEVTVDATAYEVTGPVTGGAPPIGRPLPGLRALVLDADGHPCPPEADGELLLGGIGVARGYLDDPALTRERFVAREGARWYRTGDLVRYTAEGDLVFSGRRDDQVKVHGVRIELAEVERALHADPRVAEAIAVVLDDAQGRHELAAAVTTRTPVAGAALRASLAEELPAAMVPTRVLVVDALPRTANGKADRRAGARMVRDFADPGDGGTRPAALTATGRRLLTIWRQVLGLPQLGPDDDFFRSGGDSIATLRVRHECAGAGLPIQSVDMFAHPTVRRLARHLDRTPAERPATARSVPGIGASTLLPAQRRLAVATLLSDRVPQLGLVQESHEYEEELDADALRTALDLLAERHEVLRTGVESRTDGFRARTEERVTVPLTVHRSDGSGAAARRELARSHADAVLREGFDLSAPPLLKVAAFELERGRFTLVWTLHHVISDGWSWELLQHEFEMLYSGLRQGRFRPLPAPALPLRELVHRLAESPSPAPSPEWLTELRAVGPLPLPPGRVGGDTDRAHVDWAVTRETDAALRAVATAAGCAPSTGYLLAYAEALGRVCRQRAFPLGIVSSGRNADIPHIERAVACLARSLPVPVDLSGTTGERLRRLHGHLAAVLAQDCADPDELLAGLAPAVRDPAAAFVFQNYPDAPAEPVPLRRVPAASWWRETGSEPLALVCHEGGVEGFHCRLEYDPAEVSAAWAAVLAREIRRAQDRLAATE